VYWGVLGWWGIRLHETSRDRYGRDLDVLLGYRKALERRAKQALENQDDTELSRFHFWHPSLPEPPDGFPETLDIRMRAEESRFLQDRIRVTQPGSLLAHLALHGGPVEVDYPWMHPDFGSVPEDHKRLLELGRMFATVMHGASILYNVLLAELSKREELAGRHRERFLAWEEEVRTEAWRVRAWVGNPHALWTAVDGRNHSVTPMTRAFVERWGELLVDATGSLLDSTAARSLARDREIQRKKGQSRFLNPRLLEQWGGSSGMDRLDYRWGNVQALLADLYDGLGRDAGA
jgi:hypothetical protein